MNEILNRSNQFFHLLPHKTHVVFYNSKHFRLHNYELNLIQWVTSLSLGSIMEISNLFSRCNYRLTPNQIKSIWYLMSERNDFFFRNQ